MHRHAQHLLKCHNELHTAEGESKARQAVPSSCLEPVPDVDGSVPHPRDGNGGGGEEIKSAGGGGSVRQR